MTKQFRRTGECNRCGECCHEPWSSALVTAFNAWEHREDVHKSWPLTKLIPLPVWSGVSKGSVVIEGKKIRYEWVDGVGICKSKQDHHCPFLANEENDQRLCRLAGTEHEDVWLDMCKEAPEETMYESDLISWQSLHPNCSYEFEEIV